MVIAKSSVHSRVFLILGLIVLLQAAYFTQYLQHEQERQVEVDARNNLAFTLSKTQGTLSYLFQQKDFVQIIEEVAAMGADDGIQSAVVVDNNGNVRASIQSSDMEGTVEDVLSKWLLSDRKVFRSHDVMDADRYTWISADGQSVFGVVPVFTSPSLVGKGEAFKLVLQYDLVAAKNRVSALMYEVLAWQALLVLIAAILIHFVISQRLGFGLMHRQPLSFY